MNQINKVHPGLPFQSRIVRGLHTDSHPVGHIPSFNPGDLMDRLEGDFQVLCNFFLDHPLR
jgi:hypothetical protein